MQRLTEEDRYDEAGQERIFALALELQRQEQESATLAQLEQRAHEVGLDPKYIRMAAGQTSIHSHSVGPQAEPTRTWYQGNEFALVSILLLAISQGICLTRAIEQGNGFVPFSVAFAFLVGITFSRNNAFRFGAVAVLTGSTLATAFFYLSFYSRLSPYNPVYRWWEAVMSIYVGELLVLLLGFAMAALGRWIVNRVAHPKPRTVR